MHVPRPHTHIHTHTNPAPTHRVQEAASGDGAGPSKWEQESSDSEDNEEQIKHKDEFRQWRKKHYNEFYAVKRARELIPKVGVVSVRWADAVYNFSKLRRAGCKLGLQGIV